MPTKTQINFRKQMKAYKKEASTDKEKIFSYIENDIISDYYSIKPKRVYKKSIPVAAIILIILTVGVRGYHFINTKAPSSPIGIIQVISSVGSGAASVRTAADKKSQELHSYLNDINDIKIKQNNIISQYNKLVSDFNNGIVTRKGFALSIEDLIKQIDIIINELENIKQVEEMSCYHSMFKESINLQSSLFKAMLLKQKTAKSKYNDNINDIIAKIDIINTEMKNELVKRFDELGIEYYLNSEGGITYTIKY